MREAISNQQSAVSFGTTLGFGAAAFLIVLGACSPPSEERQIKNAVSAFYDVYLKLHPSGIPTKEQQEELKKVISTGLAGLLGKASGIEENPSKEAKSGVPPMIEGDLFTSVDQGAVSYKALDCETRKESSACTVELTNVDERNHSKLTWKDRAVVVREGNRWVVDDIEYLGDKPFMHKGHLRDVLRQVIEGGKKETG